MIFSLFLFMSSASKKSDYDKIDISGEYISKKTEKTSNNVKIERVSKFLFNKDNTFLYNKKYIIKTIIISHNEAAWSRGKWNIKDNHIILNSERLIFNPVVIEISEVNTIKINAIIDDFVQPKIKEKHFEFFICNDENKCFKLTENTFQNYNDNNFYIKIRPIKELLDPYWIINSDELLSSVIDFPLDKSGLEIDITLDKDSFKYVNFNNELIEIKNKNKFIYKYSRFTKNKR